MNDQLIITHPGSAHFDDVTAVSLILAVTGEVKFSIQRREPTPAELEDATIWVVDVGDRHEPQKRNFDHHQSLDVPASFVLVADYLGLLDTLRVMTWWDFKDSVDRIGPVKSSLRFKAGDDLVNRNPVENWMVDQFSSAPEACLPMLKSYGTKIIEDARGLKKQIDYWMSSRRLMINGVSAVIGETKESFGLEEFRRQEKDPPDIVISLDRRSEGWRLYRYDGAPVDFSLIAGYPEIEFAHKSGFMAKTRDRLPLEELTALVSKAITKCL
jgi:hypothetical protein